MKQQLRFTGAAAFAAAAFLYPASAEADHPAPSAGPAGSGGGLQVSGPQTLGRGKIASNLAFTYVRPERRSDSTLTGLADQHIHAHSADRHLRTTLAVAFGATDRLTFSVSLPYLRHDGLAEGEHGHSGGSSINTVVRRGNVGGIGDASLLAKYRLLGTGPAGLSLLGGLKAPTGSTRHRDDHGERLEIEHQPGSGSWDLVFGGAAGLPVAGVQLDASLLYQRAGEGAMKTRLGDRLLGGVAISHRFGSSEHHHDDDTEAPHGHSSWDGFVELTGEWEGRQRIAGDVERESGGKAIFLSPGARFNAASGWHASAGVGLPLWQSIRKSHPDTGYRLTFGIGLGF